MTALTIDLARLLEALVARIVRERALRARGVLIFPAPRPTPPAPTPIGDRGDA